jgi:hypothetical protein
MKNKFQERYFSADNRKSLCRIVFGMILIHLIFSAFANTLVHQLQSPVLKFAYVDPVFWLMHLLHIPELISSHYYLALLFDISLFTCCIAVLFFPEKKWIISLFIILYFVYYIIFNSFGAHHTHALIPVLIAPVPFLFSKKNFLFSWEALRYFLLFSYSAAFFWKLFRFSWLNNNQGILIIKKNLTTYLYFNSDTFLARIYVWFLDNPGFTNILFLTGFLIEGFFIIGFFTKKFDLLLFAFSVILPIGFWFFADALFFEQLILSLTLLTVYPTNKIEK